LLLWAEAARFHERALELVDDEVGRVEAAWAWLRGRDGERALGHLGRLDDGAFADVAALRAAALTMAGRSGEAYGRLRAAVARRSTPAGLIMMALAAEAMGDVRTMRDAAHRLLVETGEDLPEMLLITAADAARGGASGSAVAAAERASVGTLACHRGPASQVVSMLMASGERDAAGRFLAEGLRLTDNVEYVEVLDEVGPVPRLLRPKTNLMAVLGVFALSSAGYVIYPPLFLAVFGAGSAVLVGAALKPFGGFSLRVRRQIVREWQRFHRRNPRPRRAEPATPEHCRCWEVEAVAGPGWARYVAEHLEPMADDPQLQANLRRCPGTGKHWLCLPERAVAVAVDMPAEPAPERESIEHTGQYL
jgi:hypothetical protein